MYTDAQLNSIHIAKRRHLQAGRPQVVAQIDALVTAEASYDDIWKLASSDIREMVKPEKPGAVVEPPPYTGKGSGTDQWREFALKVSDMETEVINSMGRNDLITVLADKGIIEGPDYELQTTSSKSTGSSGN